jgi:hypothetical protein
MSTSGIVVLCIEWGCQFPNSRIYTILNVNFVFDVYDIFQEHNSGVKWDLPVIWFLHIEFLLKSIV